MNIQIHSDIWNQMLAYAKYANQHFDSEIAGWGHYQRDKGIYKLAPLCKQEVKSAHVDSSTDGIWNLEDYDMSDMIVQWHSHNNMGCHFSKTDEENIDDILELTNVLISIVVNTKGEYKARIDFNRIGNSHSYILTNGHKVDVTLDILYDYPDLEKEVLANLTEPAPANIITRDNYDYGYGFGHSQYNNDQLSFMRTGQSKATRKWNPPKNREAQEKVFALMKEDIVTVHGQQTYDSLEVALRMGYVWISEVDLHEFARFVGGGGSAIDVLLKKSNTEHLLVLNDAVVIDHKALDFILDHEAEHFEEQFQHLSNKGSEGSQKN